MLPQTSSTSGSKASRSSSLSSDSEVSNEPKVLAEARRGSAARAFPRRSKTGSGASRLHPGDFVTSTLSNSRRQSLLHRRGKPGGGSRDGGSREIIRERGSLEFHLRSSASGRRNVSFVDEVEESSSNEEEARSHSRLEHATTRLSMRPARPVSSRHIPIHTADGDRFRALESVRRNVVAMEAERQSLNDVHCPELDEVELKAKEFTQQLADATDSLRRHCASLFNSFVSSNWTIGTSDTLAKRMLGPSKRLLSRKQRLAGLGEGPPPSNSEWCGPSALEIFGDSLVIEEKNPYRIVGVFARRYWDTRKPLPFMDELACFPIFTCLPHARHGASRPRLVHVPIEPPRPMKAFQNTNSAPASSGPTTPSGGSVSSHLEEFTSGEATPRSNASHLHEGFSSPRVSSAPPPSHVPSEDTGKVTKAACDEPAMGLPHPRPSSRYACVLLPVAKTVRCTEPASYPKAPVEISNMRIPRLLFDYLQRNCVTIERPAWDKSRSRKLRRVKRLDAAGTFAQHEDSGSSSEEAGDSQGFAYKTCEAPVGLQHWKPTGLPQFLRREIGNRWLPTIFNEVDVRISEYWKLENMKDRDKAAWVYQGVQTEPKPYPWEEVPMEGAPLSREEIARQRQAAASRRRISRDAELLLRGLELNATAATEASVSRNTCKGGRTAAFRSSSERHCRRRSSALPPLLNPRASIPNCAGIQGPRAVRRVR
ncbi:hypothetical protein ACSSS7_004373 [Eimeria intestinalis]